MKHPKHLHMARRKMGHIIDELYTALLHYGSEEVSMRILRRKDGLKLLAEGDFDPAYREKILRMGKLLTPEVRSPAMVEMYWELAGEDQYTSDSELSLVGQMADEASLNIDGEKVRIELLVRY